MSNDTNYKIIIKGGTGKIDRLLRFIEDKKTRYEEWRKLTQSLSPQEMQECLQAELKKHRLRRDADFVTWGFNLEERQDFKTKSKIVLNAWANENSQNSAISGWGGELAGLYREFPYLEYSVEYNDEYSEGICLPPKFEKQQSERSATTLDCLVMDILEDGGEQELQRCLDMTTKEYKYLPSDDRDNVAERIGKLDWQIDLTGLVELSTNDAKIFANCPHVILSKKMEKVVARYRGNQTIGSDLTIENKGGVLTKLIAEQFLKDKDSVDLSGFTSIDDDAAEALGKSSESINLNGLTNLSDAAAIALGEGSGELELDGLASLSDAAAKGLGKHKRYMSLGSLEEDIKKRVWVYAFEYAFEESEAQKKSQIDPEVLQLQSALADGELDFAREMICRLSREKICMALYDGVGGVEGALDFLGKSLRVHLDKIHCPQHIFCGKPRVVSLAEVNEKCGPIYGPFGTMSYGDRPAGWGAAAGENRVLSWMDQGFGLVGDQTVNIDDRFITTRPLDEFEGALIAGPLDSVELLDLPEEQRLTMWKGRPLTMDPFDPAVFREVFCEAVRIKRELQWTYDFRAHAAVLEAFSYYANHDEALQHADILLASAVLSEDQEGREKLRRAVKLDPCVKPWADWIDAWIDFPDNMERIAELKNTDPLGPVLVAACQAYVGLIAGENVNLDFLEASVDMQYAPQSPYLGFLLARVTEMCIIESLDGKDSIESGGDPAPYSQALRLGFRRVLAIFWLKEAIDANQNDFVRQCLDSGFNPVGRFASLLYLNLLTWAVVAGNAEAVRAFLEHGADPEEPSDLDGKSMLDFCESNEIGGEIMDMLLAARKKTA
jgi:hypothetical protein